MKDNKYRTTPSWLDDFVNSFKKGMTKVAEPTSGGASTSSPSSPSSSATPSMSSTPSVGPAIPTTPSPSMSNSDQSKSMNNVPSPSHGDSGFENDNDDLNNTEININDLEAITWNDETYRVLFDKENNSAAIINGFGNIVTTLPNTTNIEEVNKQLNAKQIVVSSLNDKIAEEMEDEINKAFAYIKDEEGNVVSEVDVIDEDPDITEMKEDEELVTGSKKIASLVENKINDYITNNLDKLFENKTIKNYLDKKVASLVEERIEEYELRKLAEEEKTKELLDEDKEEEFEEADDLDNIERDEQEDVEEDTEEEIEDDEDSEDDLEEDVLVVEDDKQNEEEYEVHPDAVEVEQEDKFDYTNPTELIGKWAEIFKEATCPECSSDLEICNDGEDKVDIICKSCSSKFYVDKNSGKIYKIK